MLTGLAKLIAFGALAWSFFNPATAALVYVIFLVLFEGWILQVHYLAKRGITAPVDWSAAEAEVLKKYNLYFRWPYASRGFSSTLSGIQLATFIWVPWLLWNRLWLPAILIGANYFAAGPMAVRLNPRFFLHTEVEEKGRIQFAAELDAVDSVCEKIIGDPRNEVEV